MSAPATILVVEDEPALAEGIACNLRAEGYRVEVAGDGAAGLARWQRGDVDLAILDVMLPRMDGFALCRAIRAAGGRLPILFLSARASEDDRVAGLAGGGDDYLGKPFALAELLARVAAMRRRQAWLDRPTTGPAADGAHCLALAGCQVDFLAHEFRDAAGGREQLPQKELAILRLLCERAGQVVSRDEILQAVWGDDVFPSTRTVDNFVVRLRRRLEPQPERPRHLHTVRGVGYRLTLEPSAPPGSPS